MSSPQNELPLPNEPQDQTISKPTSDQAAALIRQKVANLYQQEPAAKEELREISETGPHSKHQKFMQRLVNSGKSLAEIQTDWHTYYVSLSDSEKHVVWQEFYANHARATKVLTTEPKVAKSGSPKAEQTLRPKTHVSGSIEAEKSAKPKTAAEARERVIKTVSARGKLSKNQHLQSLFFGLGMGMLVLFIFMFGFFNERFVAPLITPSKTVSNTPIIVDPNSNGAVSLEPKIIIPKINVEVPVNYDVSSISESAVQDGLESGVVHYPTSPTPGQNGNVVVVGHSSNNLFNRGKYKFAFVLLNRLQEGDTFMMNYNGQRYIYKIYSKKIVKPNDVSVLGPTDKPATATLITCDPPGTALNRLIIVGEQISPSPNTNIAANPTVAPTDQPAIVPGNAESLFQRLFGWLL
jgi:sortase A